MGIATRMASLMRLHREETYERITQSSTPEEIIRAESARRTMVCHTPPSDSIASRDATSSSAVVVLFVAPAPLPPAIEEKLTLASGSRSGCYIVSRDSDSVDNVGTGRTRADPRCLGQDNLHSGPYKPVSLASSDVTALLPCDEEDFKLARIPPSRAALVGTKPAECNPALTSLKDRSLFATLIQTHHLWGLVARRAVANEKSPNPDDSNSDYAKIARQLAEFEAAQPEFHKFGKKLLKGYRQDHEDLVRTRASLRHDREMVWLTCISSGVYQRLLHPAAKQHRLKEGVLGRVSCGC